MKDSPDLSVVLPCYNPSSDWGKVVTDEIKKVRTKIPSAELVIVNDGSQINFQSKDLENALNAHIVTLRSNSGKGKALREGIKVANGKYIIYTDIDFPYKIDSFWKIYSELETHSSDIVAGVRGEEYYQHLSKSRVRISKLLRWFIRNFLSIPTDDTQCGLKGMNQKGKEIFLRTSIDRYLFDLEFIFLAAREKLNIKTVEVELKPEITLSKMNWKILLHEFGNFLKIFAKTLFQ